MIKRTGRKRLNKSLVNSTVYMIEVERERRYGRNQREERRVTILLINTKDTAKIYWPMAANKK